jgi:glycosyltransferase involved in cell wall biosynthesis
MDGSELSVLVATRNRASDLENMLASLATEWDEIGEVLVVSNDSNDATPEVLERFAREQPKLKSLHVKERGKARALNLALERSHYPAVAFIDDDIIVQPGWAAALRQAFRTLDNPGFQGRIRLPQDVRDDKDKMALYRRYQTLPVVDLGTDNGQRGTLTGANMAVRREVLERMNGFDARIGPGASGTGEDTELANRIRQSEGAVFGYIAGAEVVHIFDESRLTDAGFEDHFRRLGASRMVVRPRSKGRIVPNLISRWVKSKIARLRGDERSTYHHLGRYFVYSQMLKMSGNRPR